MSVPYTQVEINARLQGAADTIDANGNGNLILQTSSGATLSTIQLANPCGTVSNGVLTFSGPFTDPAAALTGLANAAIIQDGLGSTVVSGLTVGSSTQLNTDIIISNGLDSTLISAGQIVSFTSITITGA